MDKITKRNLLLSIILMIFCALSFTTTTYAWLTKKVTTNNILISGSLDCDLLVDKGTGYESIVTSNINEYLDYFTFVGDSTIWEPGRTKLSYLQIKNNGSIPCKFEVVFEFNLQGLEDALDVCIIDGLTKENDFKNSDNYWEAILDNAKSSPNSLYGSLYDIKHMLFENQLRSGFTGVIDANSYHNFGLAIHMDELADKTFMGKAFEFRIKIYAIQNIEGINPVI